MHQEIQAKKAQTFCKMHNGSAILILPNAWDVASARLLEAAGFPAIATTSAGVNWSLGYPDGEMIGRQRVYRSSSTPVPTFFSPLSALQTQGSIKQCAAQTPIVTRALIASSCPVSRTPQPLADWQSRSPARLTSWPAPEHPPSPSSHGLE